MRGSSLLDLGSSLLVRAKWTDFTDRSRLQSSYAAFRRQKVSSERNEEFASSSA